jgi:ADP-ribosylglycohydrolase
MRSALVGVYFHDDEERRHAFTRASAEITHRDPRAVAAAMAVADTAAWMTRDDGNVEQLLNRDVVQ